MTELIDASWRGHSARPPTPPPRALQGITALGILQRGWLENTMEMTYNIAQLAMTSMTVHNECTAGADASVEMPKLHNIKLLIAFILMNIFSIISMQTQRVGNDRS